MVGRTSEFVEVLCFLLPEVVPCAVILEILKPLEWLSGLGTFAGTRDNVTDSAHATKVTYSGTSELGLPFWSVELLGVLYNQMPD